MDISSSLGHVRNSGEVQRDFVPLLSGASKNKEKESDNLSEESCRWDGKASVEN